MSNQIEEINYVKGDTFRDREFKSRNEYHMLIKDEEESKRESIIDL